MGKGVAGLEILRDGLAGEIGKKLDVVIGLGKFSLERDYFVFQVINKFDLRILVLNGFIGYEACLRGIVQCGYVLFDIRVRR